MDIQKIVDKIASNINDLQSIQEELNKIGLCAARTAQNRTIICKIDNNKPVTNKVIDDYVFAESGISDRIVKFVKKSAKANNTSKIEDHIIGLSNEDIVYKLYTEDSGLTLDECNKFIQETYAKSAKERVLRATRPIGSNRLNDNGRSRLNPKPERRVFNYGTSSSNDPSRTSRGRAMLRRQANKHGKKYNAAVEFINKNYGKQINESEISDKQELRDLCLHLLKHPQWSGDDWIYELNKRINHE